ncbi:MAG: EamA family transporter [Lentisphaeria bacterium]|nr:EamA family transporter [Lentisphaeria bacterium]
MREEEKTVFLNFSLPTLKGIFWAAVSVLCWSSLFVVASFLLKRGNIDPYTMVHCRFASGGLFILLFTLVFYRKNIFCGISRGDWIRMAFHGIAVAGMSLCLFLAQERKIPVVNASMLEAETPPVLFVLSVLFCRNKASFLQIAGLLCGFVGCMMVLRILDGSGFAISSFSLGDLLIFAAASFWAVYTLLAKAVIARVGGLLYTGWSMFFAGMWALFYQLAGGHLPHYPVLLPDIVWTLFLGLVPTGIAFFAWNNAMRYISTGLLAISGYFTPIFSAMLAALLFGESVTPFQILGMILVFSSALIEPEIAGGLAGRKGKCTEKEEKKEQENFET